VRQVSCELSYIRILYFTLLYFTRQRHCCDLNPGPTAPESCMLTTRLPSHPAALKLCYNGLLGTVQKRLLYPVRYTWLGWPSLTCLRFSGIVLIVAVQFCWRLCTCSAATCTDAWYWYLFAVLGSILKYEQNSRYAAASFTVFLLQFQFWFSYSLR